MSSHGPDIRISGNSDQLAVAVGKYLESLPNNDKYFNVAISGGSLPKIAASGLKSANVDTSNWRLFFVDERYVPLDHQDSNFKGVVDTFLKETKIPSEHLFPIDPSLPLDECASAYQKTIEKHVKDQAFDLVLLGMGPDGHTASLFPGHPLLSEQKQLIAPISDSPKPPAQRVTFTLALIERSRRVAFVCSGASKQHVLPQVLAADSALPSGIISRTHTDVVWLVDSSAAAKL